jgi:hypothetical protein
VKVKNQEHSAYKRVMDQFYWRWPAAQAFTTAAKVAAVRQGQLGADGSSSTESASTSCPDNGPGKAGLIGGTSCFAAF